MGFWDDIKSTFKNGNNLTRLIYINIAVFVLITLISVLGFLIKNNIVSQKIVDILSVPSSI